MQKYMHGFVKQPHFPHGGNATNPGTFLLLFQGSSLVPGSASLPSEAISCFYMDFPPFPRLLHFRKFCRCLFENVRIKNIGMNGIACGVQAWKEPPPFLLFVLVSLKTESLSFLNRRVQDNLSAFSNCKSCSRSLIFVMSCFNPFELLKLLFSVT